VGVEMTVLISYLNNDFVIMTADTQTSKITLKNEFLDVGVPKRKVKIIGNQYWRFAISTAGLDSDSTIGIIEDTICHLENITSNEIIQCCQEAFRHRYNLFKKFNPNLNYNNEFIIGGIRPESGETFLYKCQNKDQFNSLTNSIFINAGALSSKVNNLLNQKIQCELDIESSLQLLTSVIRKVAPESHEIGQSTYSIILSKNHSSPLVSYLDENGKLLDQNSLK
jgi:20S proteasome alpha/beta subunit